MPKLKILQEKTDNEMPLHLRVRVQEEDFKKMKALAEKYTLGNHSDWVRYAIAKANAERLCLFPITDQVEKFGNEKIVMVQVRGNQKTFDAAKAHADKYTGGNFSKWVRYAILQEPAKEDLV